MNQQDSAEEVQSFAQEVALEGKNFMDSEPISTDTENNTEINSIPNGVLEAVANADSSESVTYTGEDPQAVHD
jgi:hypothetical protein